MKKVFAIMLLAMFAFAMMTTCGDKDQEPTGAGGSGNGSVDNGGGNGNGNDNGGGGNGGGGGAANDDWAAVKLTTWDYESEPLTLGRERYYVYVGVELGSAFYNGTVHEREARLIHNYYDEDGQPFHDQYVGVYTYTGTRQSGQGTLPMTNLDTGEAEGTSTFSISGNTMTLVFKGKTYTFEYSI